MNDTPKMVYRSTEEGWFAKGTTYLNIVDHEYGHILSKRNPNLYKKVIAKIEEMAYNKNERVDYFIQENISTYGKSTDENGNHLELIAELYSMANGIEEEFAIDLFREAGF